MHPLEKLETLKDDPVLGEWHPFITKQAQLRYCRECGEKLEWFLKGICVSCVMRSGDD